EFVPVKAEPAQIGLDPGGEFRRRTFLVRIIEAEDKGAIMLPREQPVDERDADIAHVKPPRRARRKTDLDRHRDEISPCPARPAARITRRPRRETSRLIHRAEPVVDRIAAVAPEIAAADLDPRRRLSPLVLGE